MTLFLSCLRLANSNRRPLLFLGALLLAALSTLTALAAPPASAHNYAAKRILHSNPTAAHVTVLVKSGSCVGWNEYPLWGHINDTLWMSTNNQDDFDDFVEIGYTRGFHQSNILTFYWADTSGLATQQLTIG